MAPRPEPMMDASGPVVSPTGMTNSIRRPKSPRRPDHRGKSMPNTPTGSFPAAENFHKGFANVQEPRTISPPSSRRRPHDEIGRFYSRDTPEMEVPKQETRMCVPMNVEEFLRMNKSTAACVSKTKEVSSDYSKRYAPVAKQNFGSCMDNTATAAGKAGDGLANFAMKAAETYRQECKSDNRGDDAEFFRETAAMQHEADNSLMDNTDCTDTDDETEERRDTNSDDPKRRSKVSGNQRGNDPPPQAPTKSPRGTRFPQAIHIMNGQEEEKDMSPPRVGRVTDTDNFQPRAEGGNLREARMELFHMGQESLPPTEARLARALHDLKRQDDLIDGWKRQLQMTQQHLDETFAELEKSKKESQEKQFKATEIRARAVQERKRLEDMHAQQVQENEKLKSTVSTLQVEMSSLKVALRNSRNKNGPVPPMERPAQDTASSAQVISLKAEIVDLRSQLAEAHAATIDETSSLTSRGEAEELKRRLRSVEAELEDLRLKDMDVQAIEMKHAEEQTAQQEKFERLETEAKKSKAELEESLKATAQEEKKIRSELVKVKANMQRLERERSRKRLHSAADVDRLNKQLAKAKEEVNKLKQQQANNVQTGKREDSDKLKKELKAVKEKLATANEQAQRKNTESLKDRRKLEKELASGKEEVKQLKRQLDAKADKVTSQAQRISDLEVKLRQKAAPSNAAGNAQKVSVLEEEIKYRKATEISLRADLKLHKSMLAEARTENSKSGKTESSRSTSVLETSNLDDFRRQLENFKRANGANSAQGDSDSLLGRQIAELEKKVSSLEDDRPQVRANAMEQSLKNDISILKSQLAESESKCQEERFRAEEERRISKESENRRQEELEELRQDNEKRGEEKLKLLSDLENVRKQLAVSLKPGGELSALGGKNDETEAPDNVTRLRNELALARARLVAARDQYRNLGDNSQVPRAGGAEDDADMTAQTPATPDRRSDFSMSSGSSSWAPPGRKSLVPPTTTSPTRTLIGDDKPTTPHRPAEQLRSTRLASLPQVTIRPKKQKNKVDSSVEALRRQLEESSKRLAKASTRLNGLVESSTTMQKVCSPTDVKIQHSVDDDERGEDP